MPQANSTDLGNHKLIKAISEAQNFQKKHNIKIIRTKKFAVVLTTLFLIYGTCLFIVPHLLSFLSQNHDDSAILATFLLNLFLGTAYGIVPIFIAAVSVFWVKYKFLTKEYAVHSKELVVPLLMEGFFEDVKYKIFDKPEEETAAMFNSVLPAYKDQTAKDFVSGNYQDINIKFYDSLLTNESNNGTVIVFSGLLMSCTMSKRFNCELYLLPKKSPRVPEFLKIRSDNAELNRFFDIYTDDVTELKFLLTDTFIQDLIKLTKLFHKGILRCVFKGNKLYLALPTNKNNFEAIKFYEKAVDKSDFEEIFSQLNEVTAILNALKSNNHLNL